MSDGGQGHGLRDEYPPRPGAGVAVGIGALWGLLDYTVLWQGSPFAVNRSFVESIPGTLFLLPARIILWSIRAVERATGHTFDFSDNNTWIAIVAGAVGALLAVGAFLALRTAARRLRAGPG